MTHHPSILITGSQRSGTTLLHLILDSYPHVRFALLQAFHSITRKSPDKRSREEAIFAASLSWRLKQELLPLYDRLQVP